MTQKVIFDTDIGLDDVEALLYLLSCKEVEVVAITLVSGNASMPVISDNLRKILAFVDRTEIPVYEAGTYNLHGEFIHSDGYFGENALANIQLPQTDLKARTDMTSSEAIVHYAKKYPDVHVICVGPLTNLAMAFFLDNEFPNYCKNITIMATDRDDETQHTSDKYADFNTICDPLAVRVVGLFKRHIDRHRPMVLCDWHFCWTHLLPMNMYEAVAEKSKTDPSNKLAKMMSMIRDMSNDIVKRGAWKGGFCTADLFAVMIAVKPSLVTKSTRVDIDSVVLEGIKKGNMTFKENQNGQFMLVDKVDIDALAKEFIDRLCNNA